MGRAVSWCICISSMRGSKKFCQRDFNSNNGVSLAADGGSTLNAGLVAWIRTSIAKKPYIVVIFQRGGGGARAPCSTSGSAHDQVLYLNVKSKQRPGIKTHAGSNIYLAELLWRIPKL